MTKILVAGAGGAPSEGVIYSLKQNKENEVIGMGSEPTDLILSAAEKKYYIPYANTEEYKNSLLTILEKEKPDLIHFQNDLEIFHASLIREDIQEAGTKIFMPDHNVIDTCVHKYKSYSAFKKAGVTVPENIEINNEEDLKKAFKELGDFEGRIWLRDSGIGGGGKGALPTNDYTLAKSWIDHYKGWGDFIAAEMLTAKTVTWLSIWYEGELVVAQTRARQGWTHGNRAISGVTGVTKVGVTISDPQVNDIAINTIKAVSGKPHGIFGVDMAYDKNGIPNPTEINISRFFTTVRFFTEAGVNFPEIFKQLALGEKLDISKGIVNPLENGLMWLRGMDTEPKLIKQGDIEQRIIF
ncbi:carboxylate--amine ligase [Acinetobacter sp. WCHAc060025]|uniref:carboxylate--amine ligase n=1 Tax=Acinetobacter sp. WCHAc060025 TaxID=2518625 RepID=UPI00102386B0|nr:carboxylate--amine ligase [Acinetobacter sp. WCHAc060025]RZG76961.1 carboxylate--amine ligase [Acinetobacter sp. WCHAc060025]